MEAISYLIIPEKKAYSFFHKKPMKFFIIQEISYDKSTKKKGQLKTNL